MNLRRAAWTSGVGIGLLVATAGPALTAGPSTTTFVDIVRSSKLVVLVDVHVRADGGFTLDVKRAFKGSPAAQLQFAPTPEDALQPGWARAVVAFRDPTTLDFRAPTIAWHVAPDGRIDPEGFQQYPGVPATLDAMTALFGGPVATVTPAPTSQVPVEGSSADGWPLFALLCMIAVIGVIALIFVRASRKRRR